MAKVNEFNATTGEVKVRNETAAEKNQREAADAERAANPPEPTPTADDVISVLAELLEVDEATVSEKAQARARARQEGEV